MPVAFATAVTIGSLISSFFFGLCLWICFLQLCEPDKAVRASRRPDLWTVHNKRYDLNNWCDFHPGGRTMLLLGKGRNCTEMFESYHSLSKPGLVHKVLEKFYVEDAKPGDLDYDDTFDWQRTPFYDAVKARVRKYFLDNRISHKAGFAQRAQLGLFVAASAMLYTMYVRGSWVAAVLLPVCYWLGPSGCMHDGAHASVLDNLSLNNVIAYFGSAHMSILSWNQQHTIGHHSHTNIGDRDPDLYHFSFNARDGIPGFRTATALKAMPAAVVGIPRPLYWRLGLLLRSFLTTLGPSYIWDFISLAALNQSYLGIVPYTTLTPARMLLHIYGRVLVAWLCFTWPFVTMCLEGSLRAGLVFAVTPYLIHGFLFYIFSQVSHVQAACFPPRGPAQPQASREWAVHQVHHTLDYATTSRFWLHLSGGLNNQTFIRKVNACVSPVLDFIGSWLLAVRKCGLQLCNGKVVHHLFPQVGWDHYDKLAPIVQSACLEFGVSYHTLPTFWDALHAHLQYLQVVNDSDKYSEPPSRFLTKQQLKILGEL